MKNTFKLFKEMYIRQNCSMYMSIIKFFFKKVELLTLVKEIN